jgi:hypothetical protein
MIIQKERVSVERSRKNRENRPCNLENQGCKVIKRSYNCPNIKTYLIIKLFLSI